MTLAGRLRDHFSPANAGFGHELSYGRFAWLDALTSPACSDRGEGESCEVPGITIAWSVAALAIVASLAAAEAADRADRFAACAGRGNSSCVAVSPWLFDYGHWSVIWLCAYLAARAALAVQYRDFSAVRRRADQGPPTLLARAAWFAHVNGVPGTIAAGLVYVVFSRDGELHGPLTDASYAVNALVAVVDVWFFRMVLLYAHVVWIVLSGAVYAALMLPRNYHRPEEVATGCALIALVYWVVADVSMMRDAFYYDHVIIKSI